MKISTEQKYAQPEVVSCWQNLSKAGLQKSELEMVRRYLTPGSKVLDVGCGAGRAVLALEQAGFQPSGIDLSLPMLAAGRTLSGLARLGGANLLNLPFANSSFQAVIMFFGPIQHIPERANRQQAMTEMGRMVSPGGRLIVGLDNLAPALRCYFYWLRERLRPTRRSPTLPQTTSLTAADSTLWSRRTRQVNPLIWHTRGLARSLRWRTWPGLIDLIRRANPFDPAEPGDTAVAQFSLQTTPGRTYYHLYRADELIQDAGRGGWHLLGYHSGAELSEDRVYPAHIRNRDKQLFFGFEKA
jgi:ubiquinone/menaquinone biosynthesis C-methylase UbiE